MAAVGDGITGAATRRRGKTLEGALLEACWDELLDVGYSALTIAAVARRAHTAKPVIYRRWPTRPELVFAALQHRAPLSAATLPDTGSLRGDLRAALERLSRRAEDALVAMHGLLADFQHDPALLDRVRAEIFGVATDIIHTVVTRAADRGEIPTADLPQRTLTAAFDLAREEILFDARPLSAQTIESIIDDVAIPLLSNPPARANRHKPETLSQ